MKRLGGISQLLIWGGRPPSNPWLSIGKIWSNERRKLMFLTYQRKQSTLLSLNERKHLQTSWPMWWKGKSCPYPKWSGMILLYQPLLCPSLQFSDGVCILTWLNMSPLRENLLLDHRILTRYFVMITPRYITTWNNRLGLRLTLLISRPFNAVKMEEDLGMLLSLSMQEKIIGALNSRSRMTSFIHESEKAIRAIPWIYSSPNTAIHVYLWLNAQNMLTTSCQMNWRE